MKNTGKCPKCNGSEIYSDKEQDKRVDRSGIPVSTWKSLIEDTYLSLNCGFIEENVMTNALKTKNEPVKTN